MSDIVIPRHINHFYADGTCYELIRVKPSHCSVSGDFLEWHIVGRKIKVSGALGSADYSFTAGQLHNDSEIKKFITGPE